MGYLFPFPRSVRRSQDFGANPGWGPNPPGGHNGDDWAVPVGTPVRAPGDGVVVFAGEFDDTYADNWGWNLMYGGKMVILNMDGETAPYFEFGHNSELRVKAGDRVRRGQVFALSGNSDGGTGVSTGPHSHVGCLPYNFNLNTNTYGRVNPRLFMTDYWEDEAGSASIGPAGEIINTEEDDMFTDADRQMLKAVKEGFFDGGKSMPEGKPLKDLINDSFTSVRAQLATIGGKLTTAPGGDVRADAAAIAKALAPDLAKALLVELSKGGQ
jgi:Peptidase family M23